MHEIGTAFIYEEGKISRAKGAWFETIVCCIIAVFCSLSQGAVPDLGFFGKDFLSNCDNFTAQLLMPLSSFITCLFLGWYVPKKIVRDEPPSEAAIVTFGSSNTSWFLRIVMAWSPSSIRAHIASFHPIDHPRAASPRPTRLLYTACYSVGFSYG